MAKYLIFHHKDPSFLLPDKANDYYPVSVRRYDKIAFVTAKNLGDVFKLTNHIDHDWTENDQVRLCPDVTRARSTSVGDLVLNLDTMDLRICAPIGWEKAGWVS